MSDVGRDHLKFSPEIVRRLGEELTPHPDQGILELVRNSYDADALNCSISLDGVERPGGTVVIEDDGNGMDLDEITNGWLLVGKSAKTVRRRTPLGRLTVGNKGLGRLAALRMGSKVHLQTRPKTAPNIEYNITIEWDRYEDVRSVEQVELVISSLIPSLPSHGTKITIHSLAQGFENKDIHRLARALLLLSDPFDSGSSFRPVLQSGEFVGLQELIVEKYFRDAEYHLTAVLDKTGHATAEIRSANGRVKWKAGHDEITKQDDIFRCPEASFQVWMFLLKKQSFVAKDSGLSEVRRWLTECGGIHLYHRGLRVQPYGDPGHDWLDMNLARVRSPEERPSTNNSIGRIVVEDVNEILIQKTDRTGFLETEPFFELRRFAQSVLEWLADVRLKESEKRRKTEKERTREGLKQARESLTEVLKSVPRNARPVVEKALETYDRARNRQIQNLRGELQLYRTLSTVGTTYAVFAHEIASPGRRIRKLAETILRRARKEINPDQYLLFENPLSSIVRSAEDLALFPNLALRLLERDKRKQGRIKLHHAIQNVIILLRPFINIYQIDVTLSLADADPVIFGSIAAVESIIINLVINAVNAFVTGSPSVPERRIDIKTEIGAKDTVTMRVIDSGPGITNLSLEEIWLPGRTTSPEGTGLGLTIVRDSVMDLGGKVAALARGELGGAEFIIRLPLLRVTDIQ